MPSAPQSRVTVTVTAIPGPEHSAVTEVYGVPVLLWAAGIALLGVIATALVQLWLGRRSTRIASESAAAAREAVSVSRETAVGVAERAEADALAKRYQDAAEQLGHDKPTVRLAGVYAMGRLADDWPEQRQVCIEVLCAYLAMPVGSEDDGAVKAEAAVRRSVIQLVIAHWKSTLGHGHVDWSTYDFDLRGAHLYDFNLIGITSPKGTVLLDGALLYGRCVIHQDFPQGLSLAGATVYGRASIRAQMLTNYKSIAIRPGGSLFIRINPASTHTDLRGADVEGDLMIRLPNFGDEKSVVHLENSTIAHGGGLLLELLDKHVESGADPHRENEWATIITDGWSGDGQIYVDACLFNSSRLIWDEASIPRSRAVVRPPTIRRVLPKLVIGSSTSAVTESS